MYVHIVYMAKMAQTEAILAYISTEKKIKKNKNKTTGKSKLKSI